MGFSPYGPLPLSRLSGQKCGNTAPKLSKFISYKHFPAVGAFSLPFPPCSEAVPKLQLRSLGSPVSSPEETRPQKHFSYILRAEIGSRANDFGLFCADQYIHGSKMLHKIMSLTHSDRTQHCCDVYVGGKVRVLEFMIFLTLQHSGSK